MTLADRYEDALLNDVMPFWDKYSLDTEHGGYFTCLDREGGVYDTDKFVWLQARQVWTYSVLHSRVEERSQWLDMASHGADFLMQHGMDAEGNWYFALDRAGRPLVQPYNIFSDCFAALAFREYARVSGRSEYAECALNTYRNILRRQNNPKGKYSKVVPGTRTLQGFALPMILCNLSLELAGLLPSGELESILDDCIHAVLHTFMDPELGVIHEYVAEDGSLVDCFDGRLINPGHGLEALWFILDVAEQRHDGELATRATEVMKRTLAFGWDERNGGVFYFMDSMGRPVQQLEWDLKLWWVHLEALVATIKAFNITGDAELLDWFERLQAYTWDHFPDPEFGEWYGYLNRDGTPLFTLKGGKWKGCFHLPRALFNCAAELRKAGI